MAHTVQITHADTHRLIPAKYSGGSVLETLGLPSGVLSDLNELDAATNARKQAERAGNPAIGPGLLYGAPEAQIVNAAYCHPGSAGGRFNDSHRGAWYAGVELETSLAEVVFHKSRFLKDSRIADSLSFEYQDFVADFSGEFSELDPMEIRTCLHAEPIPQCYRPGQSLARSLLYSGSNGIIYPSVRNESGTCLACFRPALVFHPRRGTQFKIMIAAGAPWQMIGAGQIVVAGT